MHWFMDLFIVFFLFLLLFFKFDKPSSEPMMPQFRDAVQWYIISPPGVKNKVKTKYSVVPL